MSLEFFLKCDQNQLTYLPEEFRLYFEGKLDIAGVEFYTDADYVERQKVLNLAFG